MTTNIKRGDAFRGLPAVMLRAVLKAWRRGTRDIGGIASLSKAPRDRRQVLGILQEAADAGLLGMVVDTKAMRYRRDSETVDPDMDLTEAGLAVAEATASRRMDKAKALKLFDGLLKNAAAINSDPKAPVSVKEVWLFGSVLDDSKNDVGDIDFVVVSELTKVIPTEWQDYTEKLVAHMRTHYPDMLPKNFVQGRQGPEDIFLSRSLYGNRRHHMFSPKDMTTLKNLHRPCRLAFDASRGGPVDDPVLPHHPDSKERSKTIQPRLTMPDLSQVPEGFRPTSVGWLADQGVTWRPDLVGPSSYGFKPSYEPATDGSREAFEVCFGDPGKQCVVRVSRSLQVADEAWRYSCCVEIAADPLKRGLSRDDIWRLGRMLNDLVGADAFRLAGRRHDLDSTAMIEIDMQVQADGWSGLYDGLHDRVYAAGDNAIYENVIPEECCFSLECQTEGDISVGYLTPEELAEMEEEERISLGDLSR